MVLLPEATVVVVVVIREFWQLQGATEGHDVSFCATTIKAINKMKHSTAKTRITIFHSKGNALAPPNLTKTKRWRLNVRQKRTNAVGSLSNTHGEMKSVQVMESSNYRE